MGIDKIKLYIIESIMLIVLILAVFESNIFNRISLSIIMLVFTLIFKFFIRRRKSISINSKQVLWLFLGFGIIYLAIFYLSGMYFGFYESPSKLSFISFYKRILPMSIIVISTEYIRFALLSQKAKIHHIVAFIFSTLLDFIIYAGIYDISKLNDFLTVVGLIGFASISCNLMYNYTSYRYGYKPIIGYRLITTLYSYFIPLTPNVYIFFRSAFRMVYPYVMYSTLEYTYSKAIIHTGEVNKRGKFIGTSLLAAFMIMVVMLISCRFKYSMIVIGSGSMSGTINIGDAIVYKSYDGGKLNENDIIVFRMNDKRIIHRIVRIEVKDSDVAFVTKGDANYDEDNWIITKNDIEGVYLARFKYIGFPTLWLGDIFSR